MVEKVADGDGEKLTTLRYYPLDDKIADKSYDDWKYKTMSYFKKRGWFVPFDDPDVVIPSKSEATDPDATEEVKLLYKSNLEIYDQLVIACSGIPLGLIKRADGDAREAIRFLDMKYAKSTEEDLAEALTAFNSCKLKNKTDDPDKWFLELDQLNNRLRAIGSEYAKANYELKAHYLGNLPEGYEDVLTKLSGKTSEYDVFAIEKEIRSKWKRDYKPTDDDDEKKNENKNQALNVEKGKSGGFTKKFKGKCRKCGKQGHKASECKGDKKKVCFNCQKEGHFARDCPEKDEKDKEKDSKDSKDKAKDMGMFVGMCFECEKEDENSDACVETCREVVSFVGSVERKEKFLLDSGATCHVVVDENMLSETSVVNETLLVGDKKEVPVLKTGTLTIKVEGATVKLADVKVAPTFAKNLISTVALADQGNVIQMSKSTLTITDSSGKYKITVPRNNDSLFYLMATPVVSVVQTVEKKGTLDVNVAHELYVGS